MHKNDMPCGAGPVTPEECDGDRKALATMKARAALCGCTLIEMADGKFLVARWNYSKAVPCLRAVGDLLRQTGGR